LAASNIRRDNGSAFFSRLPLRAKSAMAEILVSDQCERRPPLLIGGFFCCREERGPCCIVLDRFRLFFSLFFIVPYRLPFSRDYNALCCIFADFRPVNRLYFCGRKFLRVFRGCLYFQAPQISPSG
jgi:hypothetical protein